MEVGQRLSCRQLHGAFVEQAVTNAFVPEEHVLDDVEVVAQREVLVDRGDAERLGVLGIVDVRRCALPEDLALRRLPQAGDGLDRDRLAGAVVARQRGDLPGRNGEIHFGQGLNCAEHLAHAA